VPIKTLYNVVALDRFSPADVPPARLDHLAGWPPAAPPTARIVLVAAYARWKGQDVFLDAAAIMLRNHPELQVRFYIVGGPIYRTAGSQFSQAELRARAEALGIAPRVGFIPFQPDPADIYCAADVVVHASTRPEPFGLTIVEAMACGRAVVISKAGGAAELFTEGQDAVGVPPGDVRALAESMTHLVTDPDRRRRLGKQARQTAVVRFSPDRLPAQVMEFYRSLPSDGR
jgi:glycosyltransferase involved in cell wall biosynthesis